MNIFNASKIISSVLKDRLPKQWDGKRAILEMRDKGSRHWRQMEWIGFYFQFCCEQYLDEIMEIPGPRYGNTGFDAFLEIPWDFKAHVNRSGSNRIIVNDWEAVDRGISEYNAIGLILAIGSAVYNDEERSFKRWHDKLKGKISDYERRRVERGAKSRIRKVSY